MERKKGYNDQLSMANSQLSMKEGSVMMTKKNRDMILEMVQKIVTAYNPIKIILFGSYGYGNPDDDSDIDLFIIKDTKERPIDRRVRIRKILSSKTRHIPVEPIVITTRELEERLKRGDQFIYEILRKGDVLYEEN